MHLQSARLTCFIRQLDSFTGCLLLCCRVSLQGDRLRLDVEVFSLGLRFAAHALHAWPTRQFRQIWCPIFRVAHNKEALLFVFGV